MFLPDRYVSGTCPRCGTPDQYGDNCEICGATYAPADLIEPCRCLSGTTPVLRESEHLFFRLGDFEPMLREWLSGERPAPAVRPSSTTGSRPACGLGHLARRALLRLRDARMRRASISTSGSTRRSATSAASQALRARSAVNFDDYWQSETRRPSCTTSSARTSSTSTRCSGRRCCMAPACAGRPACTCTASSPSTARRCRSRAAPSSLRAATSTI